jgi:hypothetical protein
MATAQLVNTVSGVKEMASRTLGFVVVAQVTTDGSGDAVIAHGLGRAPFAAFAIPEDGGAFATNLAVTGNTTNIVIAGGGNAVKYTVNAYF